MSAALFLGSGLVILFGAAAGRACGEYVMNRCRTAELAAEMLGSMLLMLEYEQPTVDEMLSRIAVPKGYAPEFIRCAANGRQAVLDCLSDNRDDMYEPDRRRLETLFTELGSADKAAEQLRLSAALEYFRVRAKTLLPKAESTGKLCRSLGLIGGILLVVILL